MKSNLKRDAISIYYSFVILLHYIRRNYATCLTHIARIEMLESNISGPLSRLLFNILNTKYHASDIINSKDPFVEAVRRRFTDEQQKDFLRFNIIVLKPYVSPMQKGVIRLKYTEIINAFPFLFDIDKIQDRYHIVLEPSWESPYQMYYKLYSNRSNIYVQSLSEREVLIDRNHGFIDVPLCAGDWIHEDKFSLKGEAQVIYDFCCISNFIPFKRHEFLFSALSKHWKGKLKFALVASSKIGNDKNWIEGLIAKYKLNAEVDYYIDVSAQKIAQVLRQSKCHVLCSLREGANKANFESMFVGTPVVVHKNHIGFPGFRFNNNMVVTYTNEQNLIEAIHKASTLDREQIYYASHSLIGSYNATKILNDIIKQKELESGNQWSTDIIRTVNIVHAFYYDGKDVELCTNDYDYINSCALVKSTYERDLAYARFLQSYTLN